MTPWGNDEGRRLAYLLQNMLIGDPAVSTASGASVVYVDKEFVDGIDPILYEDVAAASHFPEFRVTRGTHTACYTIGKRGAAYCKINAINAILGDLGYSYRVPKPTPQEHLTIYPTQGKLVRR